MRRLTWMFWDQIRNVFKRIEKKDSGVFKVDLTGLYKLVDEMSEMEQRLSLKQSVLNAVFFNQSIMFFVKSVNDTILLTNKYSANLVGSTPEAMIGKPSTTFYPRAAEYWQDDLTVIETGEPILGRMELVPDGKGGAMDTITFKFPLYQEQEIVGIVVFSSPEGAENVKSR